MVLGESALGEVPTEWEFALLLWPLRQASHSLSGKGRMKLTSVHPRGARPYEAIRTRPERLDRPVEATFSDFLRNGKKFLFCGISEVASVVLRSRHLGE